MMNVVERRSGHSPLWGKPLDENGVIEFDRRRETMIQRAQRINTQANEAQQKWENTPTSERTKRAYLFGLMIGLRRAWQELQKVEQIKSKSQEKRLKTQRGQKVWSSERRQLTDRLGMGEGILSMLDEQMERKHE